MKQLKSNMSVFSFKTYQSYHRHFYSKFCLIMFYAFILINMNILFGCGKKDYPKPPSEQQSFEWTKVDASLSGNGCINIQATIGGNMNNLESVFIEVQPAGDIEDCIGCPFTPVETQGFSWFDIKPLQDTGSANLLYCPKVKSDSYRWRLTGTNVFTKMRYVKSKLIVTSVNIQ